MPKAFTYKWQPARKAAAEYSCMEYYEIGGGGHMFRGRHDQEARQLLGAFLEKHR